ncbi:MAG: 2-oxoacid:acceptor oxidoreductase subunit alpha [Candidatus Omnitrophica bacterium]|nr:2-oxoacid:acceptor oxidoreductase subunit alpha [Candidatus Omnitrophota bacterium]
MPVSELTVKISGEAGQGIKTIGTVLSKVCRDAGLCVFSDQDYMSRIRGGNNFYRLRIARYPVRACRAQADILVGLNAESIAFHQDTVSDQGIIVADREAFGLKHRGESFLDLPFFRIADAQGGSLYVSAVVCGIIAGLMRVPAGSLDSVLKRMFRAKSDAVARQNAAAAAAGYEAAQSNFESDRFAFTGGGEHKKQLLLNGNEAIALGALAAGCKFYSAYPMTPSTSILTTIAHYSERFHLCVEQAEDELAAVNMAIGASFAGVRSMTGTSGGGIALMQEGISLAGMTETPVVIADAQRPAPATGLPTRTEQGDLEFVISAGHGEFAKAVYTPGSIEEAFSLTQRAFHIAEKYQIPVFILTDQHLADCVRNVDSFDPEQVPVERGIISREESVSVKEYRRYQLTESGVSPRAVPSWIEGVVYADSDEHNEEGHITESGKVRAAMVEKRLYRKMDGLRKEIEPPLARHHEHAQWILLGWGSTCGVIGEVVDDLQSESLGQVHLPQVWPFPRDALGDLLHGKKIIVAEQNATGQLEKLLRREIGLSAQARILKYDGRSFTFDELRRKVRERMRAEEGGDGSAEISK